MPIPAKIAAAVLVAFILIAAPLAGIVIYAEIVSEHESKAETLRTILQGLASIIIISTATAITVVEGGAMIAEQFILAGRKREREKGREEGREERRKEILGILEDVDLPVDEVRAKVLALLNGDHDKPEE